MKWDKNLSLDVHPQPVFLEEEDAFITMEKSVLQTRLPKEVNVFKPVLITVIFSLLTLIMTFFLIGS